MQKSLLRVEDWAPKIQQHKNPYWSEIIRILDEFQELIETQKRQIIDCIHDLTQRRMQLTKSFYNHKTSLFFQNQIKKESITICDEDLSKQFFRGSYPFIQQIMQKVSQNPKTFAKIISGCSIKKLQSLDFAQNISYNLYPCYLPWEIQKSQNNKFIDFIREIIYRWQYSMDHGRPIGYTMIDQIINGLNKAPQIICYVEKISIKFMKEINKCKMDTFAFDEEALKHQMQSKRNLSLTTAVQTNKKSRWGKFKSYFKKNQQQASYYSQTSQLMDPEQIELDLAQIMRIRQQNFLNVVKRTIEAILNEPTPYLINQMMKFFHQKLQRNQMQGIDSINYDSFASTIGFQRRQQIQLNFLKKGVSHSQTKNKQNNYYRHYCYFLMTNLVFEELHNKFTISHQDTGMSPADLQNITQIIRIMSNIFQGKLPQGQKYKSQKIRNQLIGYIEEIPKYYDKILQRADKQAKNFSHNQLESEQIDPQFSHDIRQIIFHFYENTLILSFNDIRSIIAILKSSPYTKQLQISEKHSNFAFLQSEKYKMFYHPNAKKVDFDNKKHEIQKLLFIFNSSSPTTNQIIQYYTGKQSPLKNLPVLTKALMYNSNLQVSESLEINKALILIQSLPLKDIKYYLKKISLRYNNLYLKDSDVITDKFKQTISVHLKNNLQRKAILLLHRDQLVNRISATEKLISYYCDQLQSSQLYDRISQAFIDNIKIKAYMRIENDQLKIYSSINKMDGVNIKSILLTDNQMKTKTFSEEYLLRNSFKSYSTINQLIHSIVRNNITRTALINGRRVDQFNETFHKLCEIVLSYTQEFMKKRQIFQNMNVEKLGKCIIGKLQDRIYMKCRSENILSQDLSLKLNKQKINKQLFFEKDLKELKIDWNFLIAQGCNKFKIISKIASISEKLHHFQELFKIIFTIVAFNIPKNKISAEIINPIIQNLILVSEVQFHYECLFALQSLKYNVSPQTCYNLILYQSSLVYVNQMMANDYPQ